MPDGELFIDQDRDGVYTQPESLDDINGNGVRDVGDNLTEPFTDANGNGLYDLGDPILELGNAAYDAPAEPVFSFDDASQQAQELFDAWYVDGFADLRLLSINWGDGRIRAESSGLFLDVSSEAFGTDFTMGLGFNEFNAGEMLDTLTASSFGDGLIDGLLPETLKPRSAQFREGLINLAGNYSLPFPVASVDTGFDLAAVQGWLEKSFGRDVSRLFQFPSDTGQGQLEATARVELFSPFFKAQPPVHPTADPTDSRFVLRPLKNTDDIQRFGGGRVSATLNLPGFVEGAVGVFEAPLPNSPDDLLASDFAFLAKADRLTIPGLSDDVFRAENLSISVVKDTALGSPQASASISGSVGLLEGFGAGVTGQIDGRLTLNALSGIYGHLSVDVEAGEVAFGPNQQLRIGADADVKLLVNATASEREISFSGRDAGSNSTGHNVELEPNSGLLWVEGELLLGTSRVAGTFQIHVGPDGVVVAGSGQFSDSTAALLLGPQLEAGIDVTFAAGIELATRPINVSSGPIPVFRRVPDGAYGVFLFSSEATLPFAQAETAFSLGFNTSGSSQTVDTDLGTIGADLGLSPVSVPGNLSELLTIGPQAGRIYVSGDLSLSQIPISVGVDGQFAAEFSLSGGGELDIYADATLDLGMFGSVGARGYLELGGSPSNVGVAGQFQITSSRFGVRDVAEFSGDVDLSFNTGRRVDIPNFMRAPSLLGNFSIPTRTYARFAFDQARLDLFEMIAVGGTGSISVSDTSGLTVEQGMGVSALLPDEISEPFGGLLPSTISLIGSVPGGSNSNVGLQSRGNRSFNLPLDFDRNGTTDFTLLRGSSGQLDAYGYLELGVLNRSAFDGLVRGAGTFELGINTTSRSQNVNGMTLSRDSFLLNIDGEVFLDPLPLSDDDTRVGLSGDLSVRSTPGLLAISGSAGMDAQILGVPLFQTTVEADVQFENGVMTEAAFTGNFTVGNGGPSLRSGTAEIRPSGCLDLPDPLPDGCSSLEVQLLSGEGRSNYGEGEGTVQLEVRLTEPVPQDSTVVVTLSDNSSSIRANHDLPCACFRQFPRRKTPPLTHVSERLALVFQTRRSYSARAKPPRWWTSPSSTTTTCKTTVLPRFPLHQQCLIVRSHCRPSH